MKILGINGSYRGGRGQTAAFLDLLLSGASIGGADCESISLADFKINRCLGCNACHSEAHFLKCLYTDKDDVAGLFARISASDMVVYATPVYVFGISSLLKSFLDRLYSTSDVNQMRVTDSGLFFHHIDKAVCSKPFVSLVCCDNLEYQMPINARDYFRSFGRFMDARQAGELVRNACMFFRNVRQGEKQEDFPNMTKIYNAYQQAGYELATQGFIRPRTQKQANREVIPVPLFGWLKRFKPFKQAMVFQSKLYLSKITK